MNKLILCASLLLSINAVAYDESNILRIVDPNTMTEKVIYSVESLTYTGESENVDLNFKNIVEENCSLNLNSTLNNKVRSYPLVTNSYGLYNGSGLISFKTPGDTLEIYDRKKNQTYFFDPTSMRISFSIDRHKRINDQNQIVNEHALTGLGISSPKVLTSYKPFFGGLPLVDDIKREYLPYTMKIISKKTNRKLFSSLELFPSDWFRQLLEMVQKDDLIAKIKIEDLGIDMELVCPNMNSLIRENRKKSLEAQKVSTP